MTAVAMTDIPRLDFDPFSIEFFADPFGLISYNGKIEVHNSLLNAVLHEKPEIERDDPSSKV